MDPDTITLFFIPGSKGNKKVAPYFNGIPNLTVYTRGSKQ
jgi:hypothetical protein